MALIENPWLKACHVPTGQRWGKRIADVQMSRLPRNLLGQCLLTDNRDLLIVIYRWDANDYEGWKNFDLTLTFRDGTEMKISVPHSSAMADGHSFRVSLPQDTICEERPRQENRVIPRIVFNLSPPMESRNKSLRHSIENAREINDLMQCTCEYYILGDEECLQEIESAEIPGIAEAYKTLVPGAYKADLMRYYLLYKYGGVYLDDKSILRFSLDSSYIDDFMIGKDGRPCDFFVGMLKFGKPEVAFLGAKKYCTIMLKMIEMVIENVQKRDYTIDSYGVTGNTLMQRLITGYNFPRGVSRPVWKSVMEENVATLKLIGTCNDIEVNGDILWHRQAIDAIDAYSSRSATHYDTLWSNRQIYTSGNPKNRTFCSQMFYFFIIILLFAVVSVPFYIAMSLTM